MEHKNSNIWAKFWHWYILFLFVNNVVMILEGFILDVILGNLMRSGFYSSKYLVLVVMGFVSFTVIWFFWSRDFDVLPNLVPLFRKIDPRDKFMVVIWIISIVAFPISLLLTYFLGLKAFISGSLATVNLPMILFCTTGRLSVTLKRRIGAIEKLSAHNNA